MNLEQELAAKHAELAKLRDSRRRKALYRALRLGEEISRLELLLRMGLRREISCACT